MSIIVRIVSGVIQDRDNDSYDNVTIIYVVLAAGSVVVAALLLAGSFWSLDLGHLQWTRRQRITRGEIIKERRLEAECGVIGERNRKIGMTLFVAVLFLIAGAWAAYFWGVATGNNN
jgi:hypothetical protein